MSDNKKYYYLKLVDNFYERDEMIILESMPDGYMYSNILLKLYLRSLKNEGKLMFNNRIPYNASMLANVTRFPVAVVEKAIAIFKELGLIEVLDNGAIYMLDIQNFIGKSSTEADRKRLYRSKIEEEKKSLGQMSGQLIGQMSDKTPPEIDIDKELDIEIDEDIENNGLNDGLDLINLKLNKTNLVQKETTKYNAIFIQKKIYFENLEYLPESVLTQIKLYQLAVKRLYDNKQGELLEKVTLPILEKVFGNILKNKNIKNIIEYYISSLINELAK